MERTMKFAAALVVLLLIYLATQRRKKSKKNTDIGQPAHARPIGPPPPTGKTKKEVDVVIIGGGAAGMASAACLKAAGISYVVLEKESTSSSAWRNRYHRLHLHTIRDISSLPFIAMPDSFPIFPSRKQVIAYLDSYWRLLQLNMRFNRKAANASYDAVTKKWTVKTAPVDNRPADHNNNNNNNSDHNDNNEDDEIVDYECRFVVCATGICPSDGYVVPDFPGRDRYTGTVVHSRFFTTAEQFRGRSVLVVGFGASGCEIALDCFEHGCATSLLVRSRVAVLPRIELQRTEEMIAALPAAVDELRSFVPIWLADAAMEQNIRKYYGDLESKTGIAVRFSKPVSHALRTLRPPTVDIGTIELIVAKKIAAISGKGIVEFTRNGVLLEGETEERPFDAVVLATGYDERVPLKKLFAADVYENICGKNVDRTANAIGNYYLGGNGRENKHQEGLFFIGMSDYVGLLHEVSRDAGLLTKNIAQKLKKPTPAKM